MAQKNFIIVATGDLKKPPINIAYTKAYLDHCAPLGRRLKTSLLFPRRQGSFAGVAAQVARIDPAAVLFHSHIEWNAADCLRACARLRRLRPGLYILLSGEPVNKVSLADAARHGVDFLIRGEAELPAAKILKRILADLGAGRARSGKPEIHCSGRGVRDLDSVPSPYLNGYFDMPSLKSAQVIVARGCDNKCLYCSINQSSLRYHSFGRIQAELEYILKNAPALREILLTVSDIYDDRPLARRLLAWLRPRAERGGIKVCLCTNGGRPVPPELLKLSDSPCFDIRIGVQSLAPGVLRAIRRRADARGLKRNILEIRAGAPRATVGLELIRGLPGDTQDSYRDTLEWCAASGLELFVNHLFTIAGTELDRLYDERGLRREAGCPYYVLDSDALSAPRLAALTRETRLVFLALSAARTSPAFKRDFYAAAARLSRPRPHLFLALALARWLLRAPLTARTCRDYLRSHSGKDNILSSAGFSSRNAAELRAAFGQLLRALPPAA